jgi:hypothetical protein
VLYDFILKSTPTCMFPKIEVHYLQISHWVVVSTPLKNISQWEGLSHILWKINNVWNHQPGHFIVWDESKWTIHSGSFYPRLSTTAAPPRAATKAMRSKGPFWRGSQRMIESDMSHGQEQIWGWVKTLVPSEPQITGKWMFIPLKMVLIGIDPYPYSL